MIILEKNRNRLYVVEGFKYIRFVIVNSAGTPSNERAAFGDIEFFTENNQTGSAYPTSHLTTYSGGGLAITQGYQYSSTYASWKAFDSNPTGSMWWALSCPSASVNWIQAEFTNASVPTIKSMRVIQRYGQYTSTKCKVYGSNTGSFSGEEIELAYFGSGSDWSTSSTNKTYQFNI